MIVLVTGLMRSGTSLVARQLHRLGVPMGTFMRFPDATEYGQEDWEDAEFTDFMIRAVLGGISHVDRGRFMREYVAVRSKSPIWGVKSPFVLPFVDEFKRWGDVKVVLTTRDVGQTFDSLESQNVHPSVLDLQRKLIPALESVEPDLTIDITESWVNPASVKRKLQDLVRS